MDSEASLNWQRHTEVWTVDMAPWNVQADRKGTILTTEYDVANCAYTLLCSSLFEQHEEYIRTQIIYSLLQVGDSTTIRLLLRRVPGGRCSRPSLCCIFPVARRSRNRGHGGGSERRRCFHTTGRSDRKPGFRPRCGLAPPPNGAALRNVTNSMYQER